MFIWINIRKQWLLISLFVVYNNLIQFKTKQTKNICILIIISAVCKFLFLFSYFIYGANEYVLIVTPVLTVFDKHGQIFNFEIIFIWVMFVHIYLEWNLELSMFFNGSKNKNVLLGARVKFVRCIIKLILLWLFNLISELIWVLNLPIRKV